MEVGGGGSVVVASDDADRVGEARSEFADGVLDTGDNCGERMGGVFAAEAPVNVARPGGGCVLVGAGQRPGAVALFDESLTIADEQSARSFTDCDDAVEGCAVEVGDEVASRECVIDGDALFDSPPEADGCGVVG